MAKLREGAFEPQIRGKFGDKIYKWYGKTCVVQRLPVRRKRRKATGKLKAAYDNMRRAVRYAQGAIADPVAKAYYAVAARKLRKTAYILAKADAMKAPTVEWSDTSRYYTGRAGEVLLVMTGDLFRVHTVRITVRDAEGDVVETGEATRNKKNFLYHWKRDHPRGVLLACEAVAESRAGHRVVLMQRLAAH